MARRNLWRLVLTASLMATAGVVSAFLPFTPAGAADSSLYQIRLSEKSGFSPGVVDVRVGDYLAFILDTQSSASTNHSVTWDDQSICTTDAGDAPCWPELRFNDPHQKCMVRSYTLPNTRCIHVLVAGSFRYHDRLSQEAGGADFQGLVRVVGPSTTTTTAPPTTTTTAAPTTTTTHPITTTTLPSTTTTTGATTIRPFLIPNESSTTTTAQSSGPGAAAGSDKSGSGSSVTSGKGKDKGKSKDDSQTTPTTATPTPGTPPVEPVFDPASLTPGPITLPETVNAADPADETYLDSTVMALLSPEMADDGGNSLTLAALGATALMLLAGGAWHWYHRSSRYFPA